MKSIAKSRALTLLAILSLASIIFVSALASDAAAATPAINITGQVKDKENKPVAQAMVTLYYNNSLVAITGNPTMTDSEGKYALRNVPPNVYSIVAGKNDCNYSDSVITNATGIVLNFMLPYSTATLATTPSPVPTVNVGPTATSAPVPPTLTPTPTSTVAPASTPKPTPGFELLTFLAGACIVLAAMAQRRR